MSTEAAENSDELKDKVYRFIYRAEKVIDSDPRLALRFLYQANRLYDTKIGFDFDINCRINDACFAYIGKYLKNNSVKQ